MNNINFNWFNATLIFYLFSFLLVKSSFGQDKSIDTSKMTLSFQMNKAIELDNAGMSKEAEKVIRTCLQYSLMKGVDDCAISNLYYYLAKFTASQKKDSLAYSYLIKSNSFIEEDIADIDTLSVERVTLYASIKVALQECDSAIYVLKTFIASNQRGGGSKGTKYLQCLYALGVNFNLCQRNSEAIEILNDLENLIKLKYPSEKQLLSRVYNSLAIVYKSELKYIKAEKYYLLSLKLKKELYSSGSNELARTLNNLANLYKLMGRNDEALLKCEESLLYRKSRDTLDDYDYNRSLITKSQVLLNLGKFKESEEILLKSLSIENNANRSNFSNYILIYNTLASLYQQSSEIDNYFVMEENLERVYSKAKKNPKFELALKSLDAKFQFFIRNYYLAELKFEEIFMGYVILGDKVQIVSEGTNLLSTYLVQDKFEKADSIIRILTNYIGIEGNSNFKFRVNIAQYYFEKARFSGIVKYRDTAFLLMNNLIARDTLVINNKLFNNKLHLNLFYEYLNSSDYLLSKNHLESYLIIGKAEQLSPLYLLSAAVLEDKLGNVKDAIKYLNLYKSKIQIEYLRFMGNTANYQFSKFLQFSNDRINILFSNFTYKKAYHKIIYEIFVFCKDIGLVKSIRDNPVIVYSSDKYNKNLLEWREKMDVIQKLELSMASNQALESAKDSRDSLERLIFLEKNGKAKKIYSFDNSILKLNKNECLLEFVEFKVGNVKIDKDSLNVGVFVTLANSKRTNYYNLFLLNSYDSLLDIAIYLKEYKQKLAYSLIKLKSDLGAFTKIFYSASGLLHRINLVEVDYMYHILFAENFTYYRLFSAYVNTSTLTSNGGCKGATLIGGINYNYSSALDTCDNRCYINSIMDRKEAVNTRRSWSYLSSTREEINSIDSILRVGNYSTCLFYGENATERNVKLLGEKEGISPRILHFSTHGYFLPKWTIDSLDSHILLSNYKQNQDPYIRSGVILAGANYYLLKGSHLYDEDGILTSYEISLLNLSNTELVVLSACETGLGDIFRIDGVFGLQRAFRIAGVKNILMSLWKVPDKTTKELMVLFYYNWIIEKMDLNRALICAQLSLSKIYLNPYYWAGFILVQ